MSGDLEELEGCERAALSLQHVQAGTAGPVVNTDSVGTNCFRSTAFSSGLSVVPWLPLPHCFLLSAQLAGWLFLVCVPKRGMHVGLLCI